GTRGEIEQADIVIGGVQTRKCEWPRHKLRIGRRPKHRYKLHGKTATVERVRRHAVFAWSALSRVAPGIRASRMCRGTEVASDEHAGGQAAPAGVEVDRPGFARGRKRDEANGHPHHGWTRLAAGFRVVA